MKYTFEEYLQDIETLASYIKQQDNLKIFQNIYGVPRGGLILACHLSHLLDLPLILNEKDIKPTTIIVDDICDTGKTLAQWSHNHCYTLLQRVDNATYSARTYSVKMIPQNKYIIFWWETL